MNIHHPNCPWPERDDQLRALWATTASSAQIGERMSLTKGQVIGRARRIGLPARSSPIARPSGPSTLPRPLRRIAGNAAPVLEPAKAPPPAPRRIPVAAPKTCQWIASAGRPWVFCSERAMAGSSYCREHHGCVWVKALAQRSVSL